MMNNRHNNINNMDLFVFKKITSLVLILFLSSCAQNIIPISTNSNKENKKPKITTKNKSKNTKVIKLKKSITPKKAISKKLPTELQDYCDRTNQSFKKYSWGKSSCHDIKWEYVRTSIKGRPLVWTTFGKEGSTKDVTLIMCGVHGDEITPVKFCYDVIDHFRKIEREIESGKIKDQKIGFENRFLVVAPLANPDSFFRKRPIRMNANGIDINRNLPTKDFKADALRLWKSRYKKDPRRYPGKMAMSEPETVFQVNLIKRFNPLKIISVHAPLTMLDYDGPADRHTGGLVGSRANQLLIQMSEQAKGYKIKNYPFFPGSLGNYAGNERNIPTYTLELPSSKARNHKRYWKLFKKSIHHAVMNDFYNEVALDKSEESNSNQKSN